MNVVTSGKSVNIITRNPQNIGLNFSGRNNIFAPSDKQFNGLDYFDPGDGKLDLFAGEQTSGDIYYLRQGATKDIWSSFSIISGAGEISSLKTGVWNTKRCLIEGSKGNSNIVIHIPTGGLSGSYSSSIISTSKFGIQDIILQDIDGDGELEIIFSWQGNANGNGGVSWLDYGGGALGSDWNEHVMVQHDGAFWMAGVKDIDNDSSLEIVFCARDKTNPSPEKGIYQIKEPATITDPWTKTTIDNTDADWLHVEYGNFFGNRYDLVACNSENGNAYLYDQSNSYAKTIIVIGGSSVFNIATIHQVKNGRNVIYIGIVSNSSYIGIYNGVSWDFTAIFSNSTHPADNEVFTLSLQGDGIKDIVIDGNDIPDDSIFYFNILQ